MEIFRRRVGNSWVDQQALKAPQVKLEAPETYTDVFGEPYKVTGGTYTLQFFPAGFIPYDALELHISGEGVQPEGLRLRRFKPLKQGALTKPVNTYDLGIPVHSYSQ